MGMRISNHPDKYEEQSALCCCNCLLAHNGAGIKRDAEEVGGYLPDINLPDLPGPGLWIWEGSMSWEPNGDPVYLGSWRRPDGGEMQALCDGELPPLWVDGEWVLE